MKCEILRPMQDLRGKGGGGGGWWWMVCFRVTELYTVEQLLNEHYMIIIRNWSRSNHIQTKIKTGGRL